MGALWESKKFKAALLALFISLAAFALNKAGVHVTDDQLYSFLAPVLVYILGQGVADLGKGKAEAEAAAKPVEPPVS